VSNSTKLFDRAWQHQQAQQFPEAERLYRLILENDPQHVDARCFLGALCHSMGRLEEAEGYLRQVLQQVPYYLSALNALGALLAQKGNLEEAAGTFQQLLSYQPEDAEAWNNLGLIHFRKGRMDEAIANFEHALDLQPDLAAARANLKHALQQQAAARTKAAPGAGDLDRARTLIEQANALVEQGRFEAAAANYQQALDIEPYRLDIVNQFGNVGNLLAVHGNHQGAVACYLQILRFQPDYAEVHGNLGKALAEQGRVEEAAASYRRAIRLKFDYPEAHNNLGAALVEQGHFDDAVKHYRRAIQLRPSYAEAHNNLGVTLSERGRFDEAVASYREAIRLKPDYADAHYNLGNVLANQGHFDAAEASSRQALRLRPDWPEAHTALGNALANQGRVDNAEASYREAIRLHPQYTEAYNNLGLALLQPGRLEEAMACYEAAIRLNPDDAEAHFNRAAAWLLHGDYERGWREYEWRWRRLSNPPRHFPAPLWDGSALTGRTILVHAEQGLGDTLQFLRYVPLVKQHGGRVLFECQAPLVRLAASCAGMDQLLASGTPLPAFDVHAPLLSLPGILGTTLATIPAQVPYVHADPQLIEHWRKRLGGAGEYKIGIAWQGSPDFAQDRHRSFSLAQFAALAKLPGIRLVSLQKGRGREQLASLEGQFSVLDLGDQLDQAGAFVDTAAIIHSLDLVIAPSTAVAHLAGALGVKVWVALPAVPDWRWLLKRDDSPWYPTARLFRQRQAGDWTSVFEMMATELGRRATVPVR
jgi:tetratricopeptide (TPR) repeat protein